MWVQTDCVGFVRILHSLYELMDTYKTAQCLKRTFILWKERRINQALAGEEDVLLVTSEQRPLSRPSSPSWLVLLSHFQRQAVKNGIPPGLQMNSQLSILIHRCPRGDIDLQSPRDRPRVFIMEIQVGEG